MKTILTFPKKEIALLTLCSGSTPFLLNRETMAQLNHLLDEAERAAPQVIILTGMGRCFCAGADIREMAKMDGNELFEWAQLGSSLNTRLEKLPMPVIAAVNGMAMGGGLELALACDLRTASESAAFAVPETGLGTICGAGGTQRLPRLIGEARAKEMLFTGGRISAQAALSYGLVNRVFPDETLMQGTLSLAQEILCNSPFALTRAKRAIMQGFDLTLEQGLELERQYFGECGYCDDRSIGMSAFISKEHAHFTGK